MITRILWISTILIILVSSCSRSGNAGNAGNAGNGGNGGDARNAGNIANTGDAGNTGLPDGSSPDQEDPGRVFLTRQQFNSLEMELDEPKKVSFGATIHSNGYLEPVPSGSARVSAQIPGRVTRIVHLVGEQVSRGEVLFTMESQELIGLQQQYAEAVQRLRRLEAEYERVKVLSEENVMAGKELQVTESEYLTAKAIMEGLKARIGILDQSLWTAEKGEISPTLSVRAPISGTVITQDLQLGQFLETGEHVAELADLEHLQLNLRVYEKDLNRVEVGQQVRFHIPGDQEVCGARILRMARTIDEESRTIPVIAVIDPGCGLHMAHHQFVEAEILSSEREVLAVPSEAVMEENGSSFVFIVEAESEEGITLRKKEVRPGGTDRGYTEILAPALNKILWKGAYYLETE